ncbi:MAG: CvpA family protein [Bacteroidota bacterium]
MNWLDFALGTILLTGLVRGFINGFIFEIAHLGAYFLGLYAGFRFADIISPFIAEIMDAGEGAVRGVSFGIVFIAVWIGVMLLGKLFEGLVKVVFLGGFNRVAGALFGSMKYAVLVGTALYLFHKADSTTKLISADTKAESYLYYPLENLGPKIMPLIGKER